MDDLINKTWRDFCGEDFAEITDYERDLIAAGAAAKGAEAADAIERQTVRVAQLESERDTLVRQLAEAQANDRTNMHYLSRLKEAADHDGDYPSLIAKVRVMREQLDALRKQEPLAYAEIDGGRIVHLSVTQDPFYPHLTPLYTQTLPAAGIRRKHDDTKRLD